jgi:hypothetical protein
MKVLVSAVVMTCCAIGCVAEAPQPGSEREAALSSALDSDGEVGDLSGLVATPDLSPRAGTPSFIQSCRVPNSWTARASDGAILTASSGGGCRRFNGTFGGATSWSGVCFGDVSNCDGRIVCQTHCP